MCRSADLLFDWEFFEHGGHNFIYGWSHTLSVSLVYLSLRICAPDNLIRFSIDHVD
jgi:hypothetical protein